MTDLVKDPAYYGRPRREMLAQVPGDARLVLDVGCGAGAFGAGLKQAWSAAGRPLTVWGLEMDPAAAARATEVLDRVITGDATAAVAELPTAHFDVVILNDILEHLVAPEALLMAVKKSLRPGGHLVASVPNVRHFPHLVDLVVHGRWEYTDEGILDRTHLRFFTRSSAVAMFEACGYEVVGVTGINPTPSPRFKLLNLLTLGRWADMRFLQFAIRARAAAGERP